MRIDKVIRDIRIITVVRVIRDVLILVEELTFPFVA
jgi:hypothetical protein